MAVNIVHSRTATLVDGPSNPGYDANELQAADWNDTHPITADGVGILFSDGSTVSETMTLDAGTVTTSTPFTFKQTIDNLAQDAAFSSFNIDVVTVDGSANPQGDNNTYFAVSDGPSDALNKKIIVKKDFVGVRGAFGIVASNGNLDTDAAAIYIDPDTPTFRLGSNSADTYYSDFEKTGFTATENSEPLTPLNQTSYTVSAVIHSGPAPFTLPASTQTALAQWANVPTSSDIADGYSQVGVDTNTGDIYLAANVGGTIYKVQLT